MRKRLGAASRIALSFILFYTVATLALGLAIYLIGDHALREQLDDRIRAETDYLVDVYSRGGTDTLREVLMRRDDRGVNILGYLLVDAGGHRLGGELAIALPPPGWQQVEFRDHEGGRNVARALTVKLRDGSALTVAMELAPALELRETALILLMCGFEAMLAGGTLAGVLLTRAIRSRLNLMTATAESIISGDMSQRVPIPEANDEFGRLAGTLNTMLDRNHALIENLRQVSSDIAHDLRTPLAHLRQRLERMADTAVDAATHEEITAAIEQTDAILSLFGALLRIAEVEAGALKQYFRLLDLSPIICRICESYVAVAEDNGKTLVYKIESGIHVIGDEDLLSQALVNLLENALRHTPQDTLIQADMKRSSGMVVISIKDNGPGVPCEEMPNLARRFTRGDKARNSPGFGLGLNLVRAVAEVHQGELRIFNQEPGLTVEIRLNEIPSQTLAGEGLPDHRLERST